MFKTNPHKGSTQNRGTAWSDAAKVVGCGFEVFQRKSILLAMDLSRIKPQDVNELSLEVHTSLKC